MPTDVYGSLMRHVQSSGLFRVSMCSKHFSPAYWHTTVLPSCRGNILQEWFQRQESQVLMLVLLFCYEIRCWVWERTRRRRMRECITLFPGEISTVGALVTPRLNRLPVKGSPSPVWSLPCDVFGRRIVVVLEEDHLAGVLDTS